MTTPYGYECVIDVHDVARQFDRNALTDFFADLCDLIGMEREDLFFWDYDGEPVEYEAAPAHLKGTSAVQFIKTSNITVHSLDELGHFYLNVFSCRSFDLNVVREFVCNRTGGRVVNCRLIERI